MQAATPGPGYLVGHYRLTEKIGEGGMGIVYRARDERLDRDVAIKVLNEKMLAESSSRQRFRREALTLGRLNHPNIETVYDFHTENGLDYLVLEYVAGVSLDDRTERGRLHEDEVADLGLQLVRGLAAAHAQGVIHGDLKPANLRVTPENILKILDFGLARLLASPDARTVTTDSSKDPISYGGTLPYMSPEQFNGEEPDALSDIYSAGVVLYEMATGSRPFTQRGGLLREAVLYFPPPPIRDKNPKVSPGTEAVILKCLEKDRTRRFQSAKELAVELELATTGGSWSLPYWRLLFAIKRHRWWAAA
ncbi:MAG TPA: serine/threonine-protein kinase, partial [Candidatus Methylomirabilis sp.]|nr:serine/threonine-protein kinase [Candidatus Methylomirabilis sp.]